MANPYHQQYTQVQTQTIGREQLLILLYEGAIKFLGQAQHALSEGEIGSGKTALSRAMAIIAELQNSLDLNAGWDGAADLAHLYGHMILELTQANVTGDLARINPVRDMLSGLCQSWREAIDSQRKAAGSQVAMAGAPAQRAPFRTSV